MVDPSVLRKDLQRELTSWKKSEYATQYKDQLTSIDNTLSTPTVVSTNTQ